MGSQSGTRDVPEPATPKIPSGRPCGFRMSALSGEGNPPESPSLCGVSGMVLVFNSGSSSVKYALIDPTNEATIASGLVERVGRDDTVLHHHIGDDTFSNPVDGSDHTAAIHAVLDAFAAHGPDLGSVGITAIGHRVVMGGPDMAEPTLITDQALATIESLAPLAPLHNPANAATIRVARSLLGNVPHVAVFDTAFFHDLPDAAAHYAIDPAFAHEHHIRRYGFHGISHEYVSRTVTAHLCGNDTDAARLRQVVLHLGNGASASAVVGGRPVETSMGLTPLEGLVMGTRSGDIDPAVAFYLHRSLGMDVDAIDHLLNYESGLRGMTGTNDVRDIQTRISDADGTARAAMDIYVHRLVKYIGAYAAVMGGLDALSFTAGVGENDGVLRAQVCERLGFLGIAVDPEANRASLGALRAISPPDAAVTVLVVPTKEELSIARQAAELLE